MAGNHTNNYHLNQWEPEDKVLREEFNKDNLKIDRALEGKLGRIQLIGQAKAAAGSNMITVDTSQINWSSWEIVVLSMNSRIPNLTSPIDIICQPNDGKISFTSSTTNPYFYASPSGIFLLILIPRHSGENQLCAIGVGKDTGISYGDCTFQELTSMCIRIGSNSLYYPEGTPVSIWGIQ